MTKRQKISEDIRRKVLIEAGHRCAIPTCRQHSIDIHHIVPYAESEDNSFNNLIALCTQCHARFHRTKEIDPKSLRTYKHNLSLLNYRYSDFERRVLEWFCQDPQPESIKIPGPSEVSVWYLVRDCIILKLKGTNCRIDNVAPWEEYQLTDQGKAFVEDLKQARSLE